MEILFFILVVGLGLTVRYLVLDVVGPPPEFELKEEERLLDADEGMDAEARIRFETNQRLERALGDTETLRAHDLDGNGVLDDQEMEQLRAKLEREVRQELGDAKPANGEHEPTAGHW